MLLSNKQMTLVLSVLAFLACIASTAFADQYRNVAIHGRVYCKPCKYYGVPTLRGATPLAGALMVLRCKNTPTNQVSKGTTDKNGRYFFKARPNVRSLGVEKCLVYLGLSNTNKCSRITNLNGGFAGGSLHSPKAIHINNVPYFVYAVAPMAFDAPQKCF